MRTPPIAIVVLVLAILGGVLLVAGEFATVATVDVETPSAAGERVSGACDVINDSDPDLADRCELSGFERHGGAFLLIGLAAIAMGLGAARGSSRPAAVALVGLGAIVLLWSLLLDLPETNETGAIGRNFDGAVASAGNGLYMSIIGALLLVAAGALALWRAPEAGDPPRAAGRDRPTAAG
jgi:hypothetical protein